MKTSQTLLTLLMLSSLASANIVGGLLQVNGGATSANKYGVVCGPPLYDYFGCQQANTVYITGELENGTNIYWAPPSTTKNLTVTVSGNTPTLCQYRIEGGAWNTFDTCATGTNATVENSLTLPEGYPLQIDVNISSNCGWTMNTTYVMVYGRPGSAGTVDSLVMYFALGIPVLAALIAYRKKRSSTPP
jgi:hypothetical protein